MAAIREVPLRLCPLAIDSVKEAIRQQEDEEADCSMQEDVFGVVAEGIQAEYGPIDCEGEDCERMVQALDLGEDRLDVRPVEHRHGRIFGDVDVVVPVDEFGPDCWKEGKHAEDRADNSAEPWATCQMAENNCISHRPIH